MGNKTKSGFNWTPWALAALITALFAPDIVRGLTSATIMFEGFTQWNPFWTFAKREMERGHFPLWTPHNLLGWYFAGFPHTAMFYPLNIFFYLMPYERAATWNAMAHLVISALLMRRFLKGMGASDFTAFGGGLIWSLSGFFFTFLNFWPLLWTHTWTPLLFDAASRWLAEGRMRHILAFVAAMGLQFLAGSTESVAYEIVALAMFAPLFYGEEIRLRPGRALALILAVAAVACVAAVQLLPGIDQASRSVRSQGVSYRYFSIRHIPIWGWLLLLAPLNLASFVSTASKRAVISAGYIGPMGYIGLVAVIFAVYALISGDKGRNRSKRTGLLVLLLMIFIGRDIPLLGRLFYKLPLLNMMREAVYGLFLPQFFIILLASFGLDRFLGSLSRDSKEKPARGKRNKTVATVIFAASLLTAATAPWSVSVPVRLALAAWLALWAAATLMSRPFGRMSIKTFFMAGAAITIFIDTWAFAFANLPKNEAGLMAVNDEYRAFFSTRPGWERRVIFDWLGAASVALSPNVGMLTGAQTLAGWEGMHSMESIMFIDLIDDRALVMENGKMDKVGYHIHLRDGSFISGETMPYFNLAGLKYIVSRGVPARDSWRFKRVYHGGIDIYENPAAFERAFMVHRVAAPGGMTAISNWMKNNGAELRKAAPIEGGPLINLPAFSDSELDNLRKKERVELTRYRPDRITARVESQAPGYMVITDSRYPGWQAAVNGRPVPVLGAYLAFRAVPISKPGVNTVEITFKPKSFQIGLWSALASALALMIIVLLAVRETGFRQFRG